MCHFYLLLINLKSVIFCRYFALNTEMRHQALQTGRIYVRKNPHDGHLTVDELRDMVRVSEAFSNRVLHFGASLHGTREFWMKQKSRLIATVNTLGLPTVFFTHSAADLQWPELACLLGVEDHTNSSSSRSKANPCLADWFFSQRIVKFIDVFYKGFLKAKDYWLRFEYQHRGSLYVHGVTWLEDAPDVEKIESSEDPSHQQELIRYIDKTVTYIKCLCLRYNYYVKSYMPLFYIHM